MKTIDQIIEEIRELSDPELVSLEIFINSSEFTVKKCKRTAKSLKQDGISMQNLKGEWIK